MTSQFRCMNCDIIQSDKCDEINIGRLEGIIFCNKCKEKIIYNSIQYFNKNKYIPLFGIKNNHIKFYRKSKNKIQNGSIYIDDFLHCIFFHKNLNNYVLKVYFDNNLSRLVSLENILYYNPTFLPELKNNFITNNIHFKDLNIDIQNFIENLNKCNENRKNGIFDF